MITDQFKHEVGDYLGQQGEKLLAKQREVFKMVYNDRTGSLSRSLSSHPAVSTGTRVAVDISYPVHIRFLDMKNAYSRKKGRMVKKKKREPIYNKYVYGYLKSDVWKKLNSLIPATMIKAIESTIKTVK